MMPAPRFTCWFGVIMDLHGVLPPIREPAEHGRRGDYGWGARRAHELNAKHDPNYANSGVAGLEHLLLLKLDAYKARQRSAHGQKDARDIAKILVLLRKTVPYYALAQATSEDVAFVDRVMASDAFLTIAGGNAHEARKLRKFASTYADALRKAVE